VEDVVYPDPTEAPIPYLKIEERGMRCVMQGPTGECGRVYSDDKRIRQHCQDEHGWKNPRKRGGRTSEEQRKVGKPWKEGVYYQRFFRTARWHRLFEVRPYEQGRKDAQVSDNETATRRLVEVAFSKVQGEIREVEREAKRKIEPDTNRWVPNQWLTRTGWARHLAGFDHEWLSGLTAAKGKRLRRVCDGVELAIWNAQRASRIEIVGLPAMDYINRREVGNDTNEKPLNARQTGKSMKEDVSVVTSITSYIWNSHRVEVVKPWEQDDHWSNGEGREERGEYVGSDRGIG